MAPMGGREPTGWGAPMNAGAHQEPHFGCVAVGWVPNRARIFFFPFFSVFPYKFSAPRSWHPEAKGLSAGRLSGRWVAGGTGGGLKKKKQKTSCIWARSALHASPQEYPHANRGSRRGESANMHSYCGKTCCTLIIFSVVSSLFGLEENDQIQRGGGKKRSGV